MRILLFIGAGASVELGVPAMRQLAYQFRDHLSNSVVAPNLITSLSNRIDSGSFDFENVVDELDKLAGASEVAPLWGLQGPASQSGTEGTASETQGTGSDSSNYGGPVIIGTPFFPVLVSYN